MARDAHKQTADQHDEANKTHRPAADHHGKDDHKKGHGLSQKASDAFEQGEKQG